MEIERLILILQSISDGYGEDCCVKVSDIKDEIDVYEVRGQFITEMKLKN